MYYEKELRALNKHKVRYVVAGGIAVVLHGYIRFTVDLDIIAELKEENIEKMFDAFAELGYRPKVPVTKDQFKDENKRKEWIEEKGMMVFSFFHPDEHLKLIDVFVKEPIPFYEIEKTMELIKAKDLIVPIISIEHLIRLKREAGRTQDLMDLENLEAIRERKKP